MKVQNDPSSGQTIIALLIFMLLIITLTTVAATITIINIRSNNGLAASEQALANAESGVENALQQLLHDPSYSGETLTLAHGTATINISGTTAKTIVSQGTVDSYYRTVTATATYTNTVLTVTSWSETP